jgi:hypothetical protein
VKKLVFTLTGKTLWNAPLRAFSSRAVLFQERLYLLFRSITGGFSLGAFAIVGAIQPKEAGITKKGQTILGSESQFNFFKKEFSK